MSDNRNRIAEATAFAAAGPLASDRDLPRLPALPRDDTLAGHEGRVARFRAELEKLTGKVYGPFDADGVTAKVLEICAALGAEALLAWDGAGLGVPELPAALSAAGIRLLRPDVPAGDQRQQVLEKVAEFGVGLTAAAAGLADTGSLVVTSGPGRARVASLLPPVHIAILPVSRIHATMAEWFDSGGGDAVRGSANVVVITGPSRTADIELVISLGVHGPKEVHVILYDDVPGDHD